MQNVNIVGPDTIEQVFSPADFPRGKVGVIVDWACGNYIGTVVIKGRIGGDGDPLIPLNDGLGWPDAKAECINHSRCKIRLLRPSEKIEITAQK